MTGHQPILEALAIAGMLLLLPSAAVSGIVVRDFVPQDGICRAKRATTIAAVLENKGEVAITVKPRLTAPDGISVVGSLEGPALRLDGAQTRRVSWVIEARDAREYELKLDAISGGKVVGTGQLSLPFLPPMPVRKLPYIPEPEPVQTPILVGAHHCPLWEADKPQMWAQRPASIPSARPRWASTRRRTPRWPTGRRSGRSSTASRSSSTAGTAPARAGR